MQVAVATLLVHLHPGHHRWGARPCMAGLLSVVKLALQLAQIHVPGHCTRAGGIWSSSIPSASEGWVVWPAPSTVGWMFRALVAAARASGVACSAIPFLPLSVCSRPPLPASGRCVVCPASSARRRAVRCVLVVGGILPAHAFALHSNSSCCANGLALFVSHLVNPANSMRLAGHLRL